METVSRTPVIDAFMKTTDEVALKSIYLYSFLQWLGLFGSAGVSTPIFPGYDYRASDTVYDIYSKDQSTFLTRTTDQLRLSTWVSPLTLQESVGPFARPVRQEEVNLEIRLGFGGMHIFSEGNRVVKDRAATPNLDVQTLMDSHQAGVELVVELWGALYEKRIDYKARARTMMPVVTSDLSAAMKGKSLPELTNVELEGLLRFRLVSWASLDYQLKVVRLPQQRDNWQITNGLLLTFSYDLL